MKAVSVAFGGMSFAATSVDIAQDCRRHVIYARGAPVGKTRGTYSFTVNMRGDGLSAWAYVRDAVSLPESVDLGLNFTDGEPMVLRVLREPTTDETPSEISVAWDVLSGPRLADGRWTRDEAPS